MRETLTYSPALRWPRALTALGLLAALPSLIVGCKGSPPTASPSASPVAVSATPIPRSPVVVKVPRPAPPLGGMVPVKTFHVTPPASFGSDQLSPGSEVEFQIQGSAGQFLEVDVAELGRVSVLPPDSGAQKLQAGRHPSRGWFYALPQTGLYRVLFAPVSSPEIGFSFLSADDPLLDPGITTNEISIDFGTFAGNEQLSIVPYFYGDDEGYLDSWPTHLGLRNHDFEFHIMTTSGYQKVFGKDDRMERFEAALHASAGDVDVAGLPYALTERWCGYITSFRMQILEGDGWRGLRWVGGFGGDEEYPSCGLGYVFVGITNDARYLIVLRSDISHPDQDRLRPKRKLNGPPGQTWETSDPAADTAARLKLEKALAAASPASFSPGLDKLDAVIRSLKFTEPQ